MWPFRFAMDRRRKRGLPNMIMYLLSSSPKNGVELMDGVQSITRGWWRPTPGCIYPLLKEMTEQGIVRKMDDGRYELTDKGKSHAGNFFGPGAHGPQTVGDMVAQIDNFASYMGDLKRTRGGELRPYAEKLKELSKLLDELSKQEPEG